MRASQGRPPRRTPSRKSRLSPNLLELRPRRAGLQQHQCSSKTATRPLRIVHLLPTLQMGGAELQVLELVRRRIGRSNVAVVSIRGARDLAHEFEAAGCSAMTLLDRRAVRGVWKAVRNADVVHAHLTVGILLARAIILLAHFVPGVDSPRLVTHFHGEPSGGHIRRRLLKASRRLDDHQIFVTESLRERYKSAGLVGVTATVIPNAISKPDQGDLESAHVDAKAGQKTVAFVGRFVQSKRLDVALAAVAMVEDCDFAVVGAGPLDHLVAGTVASTLEGVKLSSGRAEALFAMKGASVLIHPSEHEGHGLVVREALIAGCAVVCRNLPAFSDVADLEAVHFVGGSRPEDWAKATERALTTAPSERREAQRKVSELNEHARILSTNSLQEIYGLRAASPQT